MSSMQSDLRMSVAFNVLASILSWAGFGVGISAVTSNYWYADGIARYGLWNQCLLTSTICAAIPNVEAWLNAVRAFMILYVIFIWFGCMANMSSYKSNKKSKEIRSGSGGTMSLAATFGVIGAAIFTARITGPSFAYGYGFGAAWGVVGAGYLAGLFNQISARYLPETIEGGSNNQTNPADSERF